MTKCPEQKTQQDTHRTYQFNIRFICFYLQERVLAQMLINRFGRKS